MQFALTPSVAMAVKSIQRGSIATGASATTFDATISAVNMAKSVLIMSGLSSDNGNSPTTDSIAISCQWARVNLLNSTTVRMTRENGSAPPYHTTLEFTVVEYY